MFLLHCEMAEVSPFDCRVTSGVYIVHSVNNIVFTLYNWVINTFQNGWLCIWETFRTLYLVHWDVICRFSFLIKIVFASSNAVCFLVRSWGKWLHILFKFIKMTCLRPRIALKSIFLSCHLKSWLCCLFKLSGHLL